MGKVVLHSTPTLNVADLYEMIQLDSSWKGHWHYFNYQNQLDVLAELFESAPFTVERIEHKYLQDGLEVPVFRFGNPKGIPVILWARQHGDEPECSAALNTVLWILFNNLSNLVVAELLHEINFIVVPMVNPAGTNRFTRVSLIGVDMNRDADACATPGAQLLTFLREKYKPKFCFNMHDMNPRKHVPSGEPELVTLAFQSAPYNEENSDNLTRLRSKTVIGYIVEQIKPYAPHLARYASNYMPRGFGDKSMSNGVSCILLESGSLLEEQGGDEEVARLHALCVLLGLHAIAHRFDEKLEGHTYETLPFDQGVFDFDSALRHGEILDFPSGQRFKADVGIQRHLLEDHVSKDRQFRSEIASIGDLWPEYSIVNVEAHDSLILPGLIRVFAVNPFENGTPSVQQARQLLQLGVTSLMLPFTPPAKQTDAAFKSSAVFAPPSLNLLVFKPVETLQRLMELHGQSEFLGICVSGVWSKEALQAFCVRMKETEFKPTESISGTLFFTLGSSPAKRHARLQLEQSIQQANQKPISAEDINAFLDSFALTEGQLSLGHLFRDSGTELGLSPELSKKEFAAQLNPEKLMALHQKSAQLAAQFGLNTLGSVRVKNQADLAVYPTIKDALQVLPSAVFLNGEVAVQEKTINDHTRFGRWFFADHE